MKLDRLPFALLLCGICLAPLPFGSVQVGAWSLLALATGASLAAWAIAVGLGKGPPVTLGLARWPLLLFALVSAWILVQISTMTPASWHHPIWSMAGQALGEELRGAISIDPQAGYLSFVSLAGCAASFWLAVQYGADAKLADRALRIFTVAGAVAAGSGLLIWGAGITQLLWFDEAFVQTQTHYGSRLAIPFVNPNHLASFSAVGLVCAIGLVVGETRGLWRRETDRREKLQRFIEVVLARRWYLLVACLIYAAAIVFSQSRGGLLALVVGLLVLAAALMRRSKPALSRSVAVGSLVLVLLAAVFAPALGKFADRFSGAEIETEQRLEIYANTVNAIEASPWLGYGYGSFPTLYRLYDQSDINRVVEFAHSTVLESIVELGIPAALVLFVAVGWPVVACWRGARIRRKDQHLPALAASAAAVALIHSMVDFPLQIPAIAAALSVIVGLGYAQSVSSRSS